MNQRKMKDNRRIQKKSILPELLAPAGSFAHLKAAIQAGADAVYIGGQQFGARAYADNFTEETLVEALHYAHFHEKKLYLTVNTLIKENELEEKLYDFLLPFYEEGLDGVIVQDLGAAVFIHHYFPELEIHGSTQMTMTDVYAAKAAARLGMTRIVPARELSLRELSRMKKESGLEIEVFVHGALCYCYSGQCLLSSMYGGRSGNRGRCAQPCRLSYQVWNAEKKRLTASKESGNYVLSPKDLCAISVLPALIETGMDSLKIEGRMKNVEYVAGVTAIYRKYLDWYKKIREENLQEKWEVSQKDLFILEELYSRSGFTQGYWYQHNGPAMMSTVYPRNLGRKIGKISQIRRGQIAVQTEKEVVLHPKDILIVPLEKQEEAVLTVPEKLQREGNNFLLNVPSSKRFQKGMPLYRRKNDEISLWIQNDILKKEKKYPVTGEITIKIGEPTALSLTCRKETIHLLGKTAELSANRPITKEDIYRQMNKTGQSPFYLEEIKINLEDHLFLPISAIKELRQKGFCLLKERLERLSCEPRRKKEDGLVEKEEDSKIILQSERKSDTVISLNNRHNPSDGQVFQRKMAVVYDKAMLTYCLSGTFFDSICLPMDFWETKDLLFFAEEICRKGKAAYLSMPQIFRMEKEGLFEESLFQSALWSGIYVHTIGEAQFLAEIKDRTAPVHTSASFYQWNHLSLQISSALFDIEGAELPLELSGKEWKVLFDKMEKFKAAGFLECCVYGRLPLMRSAQCIKKTKGVCDHHKEILFLEQKGIKLLPVVSHCDYCYNTIWMDSPRNLIGQKDGMILARAGTVIFHLFLEKEESVRNIIDNYMGWERSGFSPEKNAAPDNYWKYGIE